MRARSVERADTAAFEPLEIDTADRDVGRRIPSVDQSDNRRESHGLASLRDGVKARDADRGTDLRFTAERIAQNADSGDDRRDGERASDYDGGGFREKVAPVGL
jgi:hypothetical protein